MTFYWKTVGATQFTAKGAASTAPSQNLMQLCQKICDQVMYDVADGMALKKWKCLTSRSQLPCLVAHITLKHTWNACDPLWFLLSPHNTFAF